MLPGDADAAEHLDAVLGVGLGHVDARGGRDSRGDRQLRIVGTVGGMCGIARGDRDLLGAQQHLRAHVLDRLEAADRLAELLANLRVFGGGLQCPARQPGGLGGLHGRGEVLDALPRNGQHLGGGVGKHDTGKRAGEVGGGQPFDRDTVGGAVDEQEVVSRGQQQHSGRIGAQHILGGAGCAAVAEGQVGIQREARGALAGSQRLEQIGVRTRDDQRGDRGGGDRTRHHRRRGLVDHRAQVVDGSAGSSRFLGQGDAEDA